MPEARVDREAPASSTLIYASSGISATASGTNGYIIGNTGVTSFNGATGTVIAAPVYYVAASNAPQFEKNAANVVCSGVDDGACINTAINYVSLTYGSGIIQLFDGSFDVSSTIVNTKNFIGLNGDGPSSTQLNMAATDLLGIHFGNAQSSTNDVTDYISNMTVNGNSTSSTGIWMDGWGSGSYMDNVYVDSNVKYGVIIEDADRVSMDNVRASGAYVTAMDFRTGIVNTNGKILVTNSEAGVTYNNSVGVEFDNDADQGSPNPLDVIEFNNLHMQENSGVSSGTCMDFLHPDGVRDLTMTNSQFEDLRYGYQYAGQRSGRTIRARRFGYQFASPECVFPLCAWVCQHHHRVRRNTGSDDGFLRLRRKPFI